MKGFTFSNCSVVCQKREEKVYLENIIIIYLWDTDNKEVCPLHVLFFGTFWSDAAKVYMEMGLSAKKKSYSSDLSIVPRV